MKALRTRKGLCRDYANLTTAMCRALGLEARTVIGVAGAGSTSSGHAWSEVKVGTAALGTRGFASPPLDGFALIGNIIIYDSVLFIDETTHLL